MFYGKFINKLIYIVNLYHLVNLVNMVNVNIPIPDELHKQLKIQAVKKGKTLKSHFLELLEEAIQRG